MYAKMHRVLEDRLDVIIRLITTTAEWTKDDQMVNKSC